MGEHYSPNWKMATRSFCFIYLFIVHWLIGFLSLNSALLKMFVDLKGTLFLLYIFDIIDLYFHEFYNWRRIRKSSNVSENETRKIYKKTLDMLLETPKTRKI